MPSHIKSHAKTSYCEWATYDIEGKAIRYPSSDMFRPIFPRYTSQHKILLLSIPDSCKEIIIRDFTTREIIRRHEIDGKFALDIVYMWCNYEQLFFIRNDTVYIMDFGKDLDSYWKGKGFEVAECFSLTRCIKE
jgi:hypothetical protein